MSELKFTKIFSLSRQYNILNGYTFVLHDQMGNLALLSFIIADNSQQELEERLTSERGNLQMLLIDINEQMYRLVGGISARGRQITARKENNIFTLRENEVLYWASMGKTYAEIATIIGVSVSTIKFHMGNVVAKLGVSNARQAIRLGVELELIIPAASAAR